VETLEKVCADPRLQVRGDLLKRKDVGGVLFMFTYIYARPRWCCCLFIYIYLSLRSRNAPPTNTAAHLPTNNHRHHLQPHPHPPTDKYTHSTTILPPPPPQQNVQLYFADWGYSTPQQRDRALLNPRIRTLDLTDFACMCRALDPYK
jgi:hypothetical protein